MDVTGSFQAVIRIVVLAVLTNAVGLAAMIPLEGLRWALAAALGFRVYGVHLGAGRVLFQRRWGRVEGTVHLTALRSGLSTGTLEPRAFSARLAVVLLAPYAGSVVAAWISWRWFFDLAVAEGPPSRAWMVLAGASALANLVLSVLAFLPWSGPDAAPAARVARALWQTGGAEWLFAAGLAGTTSVAAARGDNDWARATRARLDAMAREEDAARWARGHLAVGEGDRPSAWRLLRGFSSAGRPTETAQGANGAAWAAVMLGDVRLLEEAEAEATRALSILPGDPGVRDTFARVRLARGCPGDALRVVEEALDGASEAWIRAALRRTMAFAYLATGDVESARASLDLALADDATHAENEAPSAQIAEQTRPVPEG